MGTCLNVPFLKEATEPVHASGTVRLVGIDAENVTNIISPKGQAAFQWALIHALADVSGQGVVGSDVNLTLIIASPGDPESADVEFTVSSDTWVANCNSTRPRWHDRYAENIGLV